MTTTAGIPSRLARLWLATMALTGRASPVAAAPPEHGEGEPAYAEYVEYRFLPELGQITIADGVVRGARSVARVEERASALAERGIYPCVDPEQPHVYRRSDNLEGRRFDTVIIISPPAGEGEEWTRHVTVHVDGRKKVDCSIGDARDGEIFVYGVTIYPEEGTVEVAAVGLDGRELLPPEGVEKLTEAGVITDDTLGPVAEEEQEPAPRIERA